MKTIARLSSAARPGTVGFALAGLLAVLVFGAACGSTADSPTPVPGGAAPGGDAGPPTTTTTGADASVDATATAPATDSGTTTADTGPTTTPCVGTDIAQKLACIPGLTVEEITNDDAGTQVVPTGYRRFDLELDQPSDHESPTSAHFKQRLSLLHVSESAPVVLASSGYGLSTGRSEITRAFTSNQIQVEHRFFTPSQPTPPTWTDLNIKQSAADYHRIVTLLKPIYGGHWVNTGASKGGMTSVYHRRFYPHDLDGTVAYVAPIVYGTEDPRFITFLTQVGGPTYADCRAKIVEFQKTVLTRRDEIVAKMTGTYDELGGKDIAMEHAVLEMPFTFWQYTAPTSMTSGCAAIPAANAPISTLFTFFSRVTQLSNYGDDGFEYFSPYYYQAATQLGAPGVDDAPLAGLLKHRATYTTAAYAPKNVPIVWDGAAMTDVQAWVKADGASIMFIYGEFDPWSAGKFELGAATDSFVYVAPGRNHGSNLSALAATDKTAALATITRWMGAPITNPPALVAGTSNALAGDEDGITVRRPRL